jgi:hypothetical protein
MITKSDLQVVLDEMRTEEHRTRPEPPSAEEMLAYRDGTLSAADEARVREALLCWPELLRALTTDVPEDDADALPPEMLERQWQSMRHDLGINTDRGARILTFRNAVTGIAAALAVVFGTLFWQEQREARTPRASAPLNVTLGGTRGAGGNPITVRSDQDTFLSVSVTDDARFESYRFVILDDADREVWRSAVVRPQDETLGLFLPRSFATPGNYWLVLHGVRGDRDDALERHGLRVK